MAAPKVLIKLRLKGFALQQHPDVSQVGVSHLVINSATSCRFTHTLQTALMMQATEPQALPQAASTVLRYDNEPLPNTPDERFVAGQSTLRACCAC